MQMFYSKMMQGLSFLGRYLVLAVITAVLILSLHLGLQLPGWTQAAENAAVVLDGQPLFQVSDSGQFSAQDRANLVNLQLRDAVQSEAALEVDVERRNELPTLVLNDRYLLTVTERDTLSGRTPYEQADIWAQKLQSAIQQSQAERTLPYLQRMGVTAIVLIGLAIALHIFLGKLRRRLGQIVETWQPIDESSDRSTPRLLELLLKLLLAVTRVGVWVATVLYIANLFPLTRQWSYQITNILLSSFISPVFTLGSQSYSVTDLAILVGLLFGLVIFAGMLTNLLRSRVLSLAGIGRGAQEAIAIITKYSLISIGALVLLQVWGLDISSLTILASALGVGIGFGLQDIAKNFGSGLVLMFERPIQVGDFVEVGKFKGIVERIGARSTEIRTLDHVSIIVPNSRFLAEEVINWSHRNPISRLRIPVGVSYQSDPRAVQEVLIEVAHNHSSVLRTPPPQVWFMSFGDSALNFELLVWITEPHRQFLLTSELNYRIYEALRQHQIEIPFPQRDLHLRSGTIDLSSQLKAVLTRLDESENGRLP